MHRVVPGSVQGSVYKCHVNVNTCVYIYVYIYIYIYSYNVAAKTRSAKYAGWGSAPDHGKGNAAHQRTRRGDGGRWDFRSLCIYLYLYFYIIICINIYINTYVYKKIIYKYPNVSDRTDESVYDV